MSNVQAEKLTLEQIAKLQQMKINTRLTALQAAAQLMATAGYLGVEGAQVSDKGDVKAIWIKPPGTVDVVTLLAQAQMVEEYILGNIEQESIDAMEAAKQKLDPNRPRIVRP